MSLAEVSHARLPEVIGAADVVIDEIGPDDYGITAVAGLAAGRVVLGMVSEDVREHVRRTTDLELPITQVDPDTVREVVLSLRDLLLAPAGASGAHLFSSPPCTPGTVRLPLWPSSSTIASTMPTSVPHRSPVTVPPRPDLTTGRRPHVLYVAWGFPPCRGGRRLPGPGHRQLVAPDRVRRHRADRSPRGVRALHRCHPRSRLSWPRGSRWSGSISTGRSWRARSPCGRGPRPRTPSAGPLGGESSTSVTSPRSTTDRGSRDCSRRRTRSWPAVGSISSSARPTPTSIWSSARTCTLATASRT